ncbi:uncharacterized protein [Chironomus tepperi]|uniref:uncharacterized protein n=1 Tax=Chironomus tepperi TaxID=113505 RepID=UPI00391F5629
MTKRFAERPEQRENVKIYSINGEIDEDATFVAVMHDYNILVATLDLTFNSLKAALNGLKFDTPKKFVCVRELYRDTVIEFIKNEGLETIFESLTTMVYMSYEDAINLEYEVPAGLVIRRLSTSDAKKINSVWPHKYQGSESFISHIIDVNLSVGLYDEKSGELIAWCHEHDISTLFVLQVDEKHLRKGYAGLVTKAITKHVAQEHGYCVNTNIMRENFKSMALFEKLSFKKIDNNSWLAVRKME